MKERAREARADGRIVGLVPTMGALHAGHIALFERAQVECAPVYGSIFVNPKQFGPNEDFAKYPRAFEADLAKLSAAGVDAVFAPEPAEMYPPGFATHVGVDGISERLEGRSRPGHFLGVTTVVMKLLQIVQPQRAYFGRKDAQQARIVQQMARDMSLDSEIVVCPIVREADGLALSSRNAYLDAKQRAAATVLHGSLKAAKRELSKGERDALQLETAMHRVLDAEPLCKVDYVEIVNAETFEPTVRINGSCYVLLAAYFGKTRLIDNLYIEPAPDGGDQLLLDL
jgi:pantoate--beta-alanine ligase